MSDIPKTPSDLVFLILCRVPAEYLLNLKLVCKSWRRMIDDPYFRQSHTAQQRINQFSSSSIYLFNLNQDKYILSLNSFNYDFNFNFSFNFTHSESPISIIPHKFFRLASDFYSCNGLILINEDEHRWSGSWSIVNPFTRELYKLPLCDDWKFDAQKGFFCAGFGYDFDSDDYKILHHKLIVPNFKPVKIETFIYSLKSNLWKQFENDCCFIYMTRGVFCNGALHWIGRRRVEETRHTIVAFDLGSEDVRFVSMGKLRSVGSFVGGDLELGELGGRLSLTRCIRRWDSKKFSEEIYLMGNYGDKRSWSKIYSVDKLESSLRPIYYSASEEFLLLLKENNTEFLLVNLKHNTTKILENPYRHARVYKDLQIYQPSFVPIIEGADNPRQMSKKQEKRKIEGAKNKGKRKIHE